MRLPAIPALDPSLAPVLHRTYYTLHAYLVTTAKQIVRITLEEAGVRVGAPLTDQIWTLKHPVTALAIGDDYAYFGNSEGSVYQARLLPSNEIKIVDEVLSFQNPVKKLALSPSGEFLVCASENCNDPVQVVKLETSQVVSLSPQLSHPVMDVAIDPQEEALGVTAADGMLYIYDFPPAYKLPAEDDEEQELMDLLKEDLGLTDPNAVKMILRCTDMVNCMDKLQLGWSSSALWVGSRKSALKVPKGDYKMQEFTSYEAKKGVWERLTPLQGSQKKNQILAQFQDTFVLFEGEKQLKTWTQSDLSKWAVFGDLCLSLTTNGQLDIHDLAPERDLAETNPFLPKSIGLDKENELDIVQELLDEQVKAGSALDQKRILEELTSLHAQKTMQPGFNNSSGVIKNDIIEQEYLLHARKEGVLIRTVSGSTDVLEVQFRAEIDRGLNTKVVNHFSSEIGCFSRQGILTANQTTCCLYFTKLRDSSVFLSNWEAQLAAKPVSIAMAHDYHAVATVEGEIYLYSVSGLLLGTVTNHPYILTLAAFENTLAVLHHTAKDSTFRQNLRLETYRVNGFGERQKGKVSVSVPLEGNGRVQWLGFVDHRAVLERADGSVPLLPVVQSDAGAVQVFTQSGVWVEVRKLQRERVFAVELDAIKSYDMRFPMVENQSNFESGEERGIVMLKACMAMVSPRLDEDTIRGSAVLSRLNEEFERKVMQGVKVALSDQRYGLALDNAQLMMTETGFQLAARTAKNLGAVEVAERIQALGMEKRSGVLEEPEVKKNPILGLLDDHEEVDLNNIRMKYGLRSEKEQQEPKKLDFDSEVGYSGASSFSFQLSKGTEEILQMQKTEESKREHTVEEETTTRPKKAGKLFGKLKPETSESKPSFMDALSHGLLPKRRAKRS